MSLITLPIDLISRALDDVGAIARVARELPDRLDTLEARADKVQEQLDRALTIGETIADNSAAMVELGQSIEARGEAMVDLGERMIVLGNAVLERSAVISDRAKEVADRGAEVAAALPVLERAVSMASPLEGTVERLGRALDRLPGGRAGRNVTSADET
jgi:uncharacterized protein Yka (UPF0111/DUF47 family)